MIDRRFLTIALGYVAVTFVLAVLWHLVLFKGVYDALGYVGRKEPIFALGLLSMVVQGAALGGLFPRFARGGDPYREGLRFSLAMGAFFWSCHVLAAAAKNPISPIPTFVAIETAYLLIQFTLAGLIIGWAHRPGTAPAARFAAKA
ncbi:MAG: hypothetical protein HYZ11_05460 [Candidatus Tectomicrobia bacterium]|uniref:Uncharacterized protein n=1 Tax=Tectimicrobiota bacterium TaxID=2528274 RepID=A0A932MPC9_UNCTE|nr:hypothetical protein [Candidatus Tectomicrobia bacterium]